ncbi:sulfite exporter TauE/SafE family protein [Bengtsoniella intestinalis]|uniref:sulfite exporter TauE/SafE family protein n=1 Tax=Bengtsoniella intestinalis TaxID=3073143 RepID=UPI00391F70E9
MTMCIIALCNFLVGGLIGICGIAGFLLPMLYAGGLGYSVQLSLTLSFFAFLISGSIGSWNFHKQGNLDLKFSTFLCGGSVLGGLVGVMLNSLIPATQAKTLLYLVVLLSGISILYRNRNTTAVAKERHELLDSKAFVVAVGVVTGAICSLSGAGGPVLVMPLLVVLGISVHMAIGIALFDSIFIALPAFVGYCYQLDALPWTQFLLVGVTHGLGTYLGSRNAHKINQKPLKTAVSVGSIVLAVYMLSTLL